MDHADRKVAREILTSQGTLLVHVIHELYLVAHKQRDGLTDKEYQFLMDRRHLLEEEGRKLQKLVERLRKHA